MYFVLQQEYKNEGISADMIEFVDNRPVLDMFLAKPVGVLALLDEESNFPKASDYTLVGEYKATLHLYDIIIISPHSVVMLWTGHTT